MAAENDIFAAHLEMADDPMLAEQVEERISEHGFSAERALDGACEEVCGMLAALDDEYLGGPHRRRGGTYAAAYAVFSRAKRPKIHSPDLLPERSSWPRNWRRRIRR